jgi:hypothetical protein
MVFCLRGKKCFKIISIKTSQSSCILPSIQISISFFLQDFKTLQTQDKNFGIYRTMDYVRSFVSCCLSVCTLEENDVTVSFKIIIKKTSWVSIFFVIMRCIVNFVFQGTEPNERTHLLNNEPIPSVHHRQNNDINEYPNSLAKNVDEGKDLKHLCF